MRPMRPAGQSRSTTALRDQSLLAIMFALTVALLVWRLLFVAASESSGYALDALLLVAVTWTFDRAQRHTVMLADGTTMFGRPHATPDALPQRRGNGNLRSSKKLH